MRLAKLLTFSLLLLLVGCDTKTKLGRIEKIERISTITVSYTSPKYGEVTRKFLSSDKESQDVKVGDVIKFNDFGFVGKVNGEK